ncbi:MAG TPA: tetratricopeptide repeat protein, partial [Thermoanaerobaculia bacterium]|nr:tetratricopeptide repeat protein [Thermoanaerobaculia bacterium]
MLLRTLRPLVATAVLALAGCSPTASQEPGRSSSPEAGQELGRVEMAATGAPEARPWFERGVAALHSFWYDEAAKAFRQAREIDPGFVLAYWGEAMTHNHPIWDQVELDEGRAALATLAPTPAERAAKAPTERERAYLAAVELLFAENGEKHARDEAYLEAMARLAERWPDDFEARTFHALALEGVAYGGGVPDERRFSLLMRAAAELEELFDDRPDHPGVLHYLIHAYDDPVHAPLGLRAARLYAEVAPAAHHALHMPSHIFVQLGRWDQAAASNEDAWAASAAWVEEDGLPLGHRDYHSLSWLLYAYLQQGRLAAARELLDLVGRDAEASPGRRLEHARDERTARY